MTQALRVTAPISAAALVAVGGVFFGLFSCGGHEWHRQLFWTLLTPCLVLTVLAPAPILKRGLRRLIFVAFVLAGFVAVRGAASTFYPGPPASFTDFVRGTWLGITTGPC